MKKIGITGNIASGKSTVEKIIANMGFSVIDADNISHDAMSSNQNIINLVKNLFKDFDILNDEWELDRKKIGKIVFGNQNYRHELENIIHPFVIKEIQKFISEHDSEKLVFVSVPLLFEAGLDKIFDKTVLVVADEDTRLERLMKRNNYTREHALQRINAQKMQADKIKLADFVIDNNSDLSNLEKNTKIILNQLL